MILAVDVDYHASGSATVAGVLFPTWESAEPARELAMEIGEVERYLPGNFYLRELPCIRRLLDEVKAPFECIIIDGYVFLGPDRRPGLGMHLWEELGGRVPVIGVAKSRFRGTPEETELLRGWSRRPLYVTSAGVDLTEAKERIRRMKGSHRIPDLLKRVDRLCREGREESAGSRIKT